VEVGQELAVLHNPQVESAAARARVEMITAQSDYSRAQLSYASLGSAIAKRDEMSQRDRLAKEQRDRLVLKSPVKGVVTTRNPQDEIGSYRGEGDTVLEIAGTGAQIAEAYVPESEFRNLKVGQRADLFLEGLGGVRKGTVVKLSTEATSIAGGLMHMQELKGLEAPKYYVADIAVDGAIALPDQSTASAKIMVGRISAASIIGRQVRDFLGRKLW
jgi:multidrug resistance efflux pump